MKDLFAGCHPITETAFLGGAILLGVCVHHPAYLLCACIGSCLYLLRLRGREAVRSLCGIALLMLLITAINPLFNPLGETAVFLLPGGRPYTLEALLYGVTNALMIGNILIWFACYNEIMTEDKWLCVFGKAAPAITMLLTMVLRLVPGYRRKAGQIQQARQCIGKAGAQDTFAAKAADGAATLTALLGWALEGSAAAADSMQARGYGAGKRTQYSIYRFPGWEKGLLAGAGVSLVGASICVLQGGAYVVCFPTIELADFKDPFFTAGLVFYSIYMMIPVLVNLKEDIVWHNWKSTN